MKQVTPLAILKQFQALRTPNGPKVKSDADYTEIKSKRFSPSHPKDASMIVTYADGSKFNVVAMRID